MNSGAIIRSQVSQVVRQIAAQYAEEMIGIQVKLARNGKIKSEVRLKATMAVLDRAAGKPTQELADEGTSGDAILERMREAAAKAREVMNQGALPPPSERPMAEVIELRPDKSGTYEPARIPRRRLKDG